MSLSLNAADLRRMGYELKGDGTVAKVGDALPRPISKHLIENWTDDEGYFHYAFTLYSEEPPRTKKNSSQAVRMGEMCPLCKLRKGPARVFPSKAFRAWQKGLIAFVDKHPELRLCLEAPIAVRALVYRDRNVGDFDGFMQALGDGMQEAGIILNDRQIQHRDGSRLRVDHVNPRIEVDITILGQRLSEQPDLTERGDE